MAASPANDDWLDHYDYGDDAVLAQTLHDRDRRVLRDMLAYGRDSNQIGKQMTAHQGRVARDGERFLRYLGYSPRAARNFRTAMLFHDLGKIHASYDPALWSLIDRPTPEEKRLQKLHTRLGVEMLADGATAALQDHPHYSVRHALTLYHHERLDGKGPEGVKAASLPVFVQVACLVDAYDGDRILRPHQKQRRTPRETLDRMADPDGKYAGAFDPGLIQCYAAMKMAENGH